MAALPARRPMTEDEVDTTRTRPRPGNAWRRLAVAAALACGLATGPAPAGDRALIIGINAYPHLGERQQLRAAVGDSEKMAVFATSTLGFAPDEVTHLTDTDATRDAVIAAIEQKLIAETGPGDRVLLFFAGHGTRGPDRDGDEEDGRDEVLVMSDINGPAGPGVLVDDELGAMLDRIQDRKVVVVIDSCHSGTVTRAMGQEDARARTIVFDESARSRGALSRSEASITYQEEPIAADRVSRTVWSAAAPSQYSWEDRQGGVFTRLFLDGFAGRADANGNGKVSNAELLAFVRAGSRDFCANSRSCTREGLGLTPDFSGQVQTYALFGEDDAPVFEGIDAGVPPGMADDGEGDDGAAATEPGPADAPPAAPADPTDIGPILSDLFVPNNAAGLEVAIRPGPDLRLRQEVRFEVSTRRPGRLLILDLNPEGDLYQIFPSILARPDAPRIAPGETVTIPGDELVSGQRVVIRVTEPAGRGRLLAILVEDELDAIAALLPQNVNLAPVPDAAGWLARLAHLLNDMQGSADGNSAVAWSGVVLDYTIAR